MGRLIGQGWNRDSGRLSTAQDYVASNEHWPRKDLPFGFSVDGYNHEPGPNTLWLLVISDPAFPNEPQLCSAGK